MQCLFQTNCICQVEIISSRIWQSCAINDIQTLCLDYVDNLCLRVFTFSNFESLQLLTEWEFWNMDTIFLDIPFSHIFDLDSCQKMNQRRLSRSGLSHEKDHVSILCFYAGFHSLLNHVHQFFNWTFRRFFFLILFGFFLYKFKIRFGIF